MESISSSTRSSRAGRETSSSWSTPEYRSSDSTYNENVLDGFDTEPIDALVKPSAPRILPPRPPRPSSLTKPNYSSTKPQPRSPSPPARELSPSPKPKVRPSRPSYGDFKKLRTVIAIDYGTTFTSAAIADATSNEAETSEVKVVQYYGPNMSNQRAVPSVFSYADPTPECDQWGSSISEDAVTMINQKMELPVQDKKIDELELTLQVLNGIGNLEWDYIKSAGTRPKYTWKSPTQIITDYLSKVQPHVLRAVDDVQSNDKNAVELGKFARSQNVIDIVISVPVGWSYEAMNSTFKAFTNAGFNKKSFPQLNDVILVKEPEAASYCTVRDFHLAGAEFLRKGENFVLCDAGGGTVDVISYQVKKLKPYLKLKEVSHANNDKCGSSYIDNNFKTFLRKIIGKKEYAKIDTSNAGQRINTYTTESGMMRELMEQFDREKKNFSNKVEEIQLDLPGPLRDLTTTDGKVYLGGLTIKKQEMKKELFDPCVTKVIKLIEAQVLHCDMENNRRVQNVFLVGGFGESPYLQEELQKSLGLRQIAMRRPEKMAAWTATVRGAAIYGIEKARHKKLRLMTMSKRYYGIVVNEPFSVAKFELRDCYTDALTHATVARQQFSWMIQKGDLILSDERKLVEKDFTFSFRKNERRNFDLKVYTYRYDNDNVPLRWSNGQKEVKEIGIVACDLSNFAFNKFEWHENDEGEAYMLAYLVCRMQMSQTEIEVEVLFNQVPIGTTQIPVQVEDMEEDSDDDSDSDSDSDSD